MPKMSTLGLQNEAFLRPKSAPKSTQNSDLEKRGFRAAGWGLDAAGRGGSTAEAVPPKSTEINQKIPEEIHPIIPQHFVWCGVCSMEGLFSTLLYTKSRGKILRIDISKQIENEQSAEAKKRIQQLGFSLGLQTLIHLINLDLLIAMCLRVAR